MESTIIMDSRPACQLLPMGGQVSRVKMIMQNFKKDFASFDDKVWLNAASEGPLPLAAAQTLQEAVTWKSRPYLLTNQRFISTAQELKKSIGRLNARHF